MDVPGFALITGAGSGIGKACAQAFVAEGSAGVALLDINREAILSVHRDLEMEVTKRQETETEKHKSCKILSYEVDVTDEEQVHLVIKEAATRFGRLDYVVNAAGISIKHAGGAPFVITEDWHHVLDVNLNGTFFVLRAAAQIMLTQDKTLSSIGRRPLQCGSIVNVSSILGQVAIPSYTAYTASKHAIIGLTQSASLDYAKHGLRINTICPGYTETPMTLKPGTWGQDVVVACECVPMRRMAVPKEIADGVLFLAGGRSSYVTGSALVVDGGHNAK